MNTENALTTDYDIDDLLREYPDLTYEGWRTPQMTPTQFAEAREKLKGAVAEIDLCRRMFYDQRFRQGRRGKRFTAYQLKHVAESWDFSLKPSSRPEFDRHHYNFYVCQGSATAAALLDFLKVVRQGATRPGSVITIPKGGLN